MKIKCKASKDYCNCALDAAICDGRHFCECGGSWDGASGRPLLFPHDGPWQEAVNFTDRLFAAGPLASLLAIAEQMRPR